METVGRSGHYYTPIPRLGVAGGAGSDSATTETRNTHHLLPAATPLCKCGRLLSRLIVSQDKVFFNLILPRNIIDNILLHSIAKSMQCLNVS